MHFFSFDGPVAVFAMMVCSDHMRLKTLLHVCAFAFAIQLSVGCAISFFFFLSLRLFPMPFSIRVRFFRSRRFSMHSRSIPFARCVFCESERERAEVCKWINACDFLCCGFLCSQYSYEWKFIVKSDHVFWYAVLMLALPITQCGFCSRWRQRWRRRRRRQPRC